MDGDVFVDRASGAVAVGFTATGRWDGGGSGVGGGGREGGRGGIDVWSDPDVCF